MDSQGTERIAGAGGKDCRVEVWRDRDAGARFSRVRLGKVQIVSYLEWSNCSNPRGFYEKVAGSSISKGIWPTLSPHGDGGFIRSLLFHSLISQEEYI